jgi:hypothetical protein
VFDGRIQRRSFTDRCKQQSVDIVAASGRSAGSLGKTLRLRASDLRRLVEQGGPGARRWPHGAPATSEAVLPLVDGAAVFSVHGGRTSECERSATFGRAVRDPCQLKFTRIRTIGKSDSCGGHGPAGAGRCRRGAPAIGLELTWAQQLDRRRVGMGANAPATASIGIDARITLVRHSPLP